MMSIKAAFLAEWCGVAAAFQKWGDALRAQSASATAWIIELAGVQSGMSVLDLASGVGIPALELARRVGPAGRVVATDLVGGALAMLEQAARAEGLTWLTTEVADMESLPFGDASFDAVTCRLGIMFCPEPARALAEVRRILKPGGRAAFVVWGSADQPLFASTLSEVRASLASQAEPAADAHEAAVELASGPGPFRFEMRGSLALSLERAGFSAVAEAERQIPWPFHGSPEQFWQMFTDLAGPSLQQAIARLESAQQAELLTRVTRNLASFQRGAVLDPTARVVACCGTA